MNPENKKLDNERIAGSFGSGGGAKIIAGNGPHERSPEQKLRDVANWLSSRGTADGVSHVAGGVEIDTTCSKCGREEANYCPGEGQFLLCEGCGHLWLWDVE